MEPMNRIIETLFFNRYRENIEDLEHMSFSPDWVTATFFFAPLVSIFLMKLNIAFDEWYPLPPYLFALLATVLYVVSLLYFLLNKSFKEFSSNIDKRIYWVFLILSIMIYWILALFVSSESTKSLQDIIFQLLMILLSLSMIFLVVFLFVGMLFSFSFLDNYIGCRECNKIMQLLAKVFYFFIVPFSPFIILFFLDNIPSIKLTLIMSSIYFFGLLTHYLYNTAHPLMGNG